MKHSDLRCELHKRISEGLNITASIFITIYIANYMHLK